MRNAIRLSALEIDLSPEPWERIIDAANASKIAGSPHAQKHSTEEIDPSTTC